MKYLLPILFALLYLNCSEDPGTEMGLAPVEKLPTPEVKITYPAEGDTITQSFDLKAEFVNCIGFSRVEVDMVNSYYYSYNPSNPVILHVDINKFRTHDYKFKVYMYDHFGNLYTAERNIFIKKP